MTRWKDRDVGGVRELRLSLLGAKAGIFLKLEGFLHFLNNLHLTYLLKWPLAPVLISIPLLFSLPSVPPFPNHFYSFSSVISFFQAITTTPSSDPRAHLSACSCTSAFTACVLHARAQGVRTTRAVP